MRDDALDVLLVRPEHAREKRSKDARDCLRVFPSRALHLPEQPDAKQRERPGRDRFEIFLEVRERSVVEIQREDVVARKSPRVLRQTRMQTDQKRHRRRQIIQKRLRDDG